ncbi:hypothetical protein H9W91_07125 [Streptomyces alfalfae]|uniref:hypothetical protein n=1 Tax=Streptomyces alfalfae TaxID=1642299 RepID=UPI001BA9DB8C|nr:hypothetical protein [Streptomyces alfalfae]QUI30660.1 hypothetical protein H9W91_07125 [Streptomyces alfalfae]
MTEGNKVRVTLKGGKGYDAPWITIDGTDVADALAQLDRKDEVKALVDAAAKIGRYFASTGEPAGGGSAPKRFENGKVVGGSGGGGGGERQGDTTCAHGDRTYRSGGSWEAMFCPARDKSEQCPPAWKDKKTGKFVVKG